MFENQPIIPLTKGQDPVRSLHNLQQILHCGQRTDIGALLVPQPETCPTCQYPPSLVDKDIDLFSYIESVIFDLIQLHSLSHQKEIHFIIIQQRCYAESQRVPDSDHQFCTRDPADRGC